MYLAGGSYALSLINLYFPRLVPSCFITIVLQCVTSLHFFSNVTGIFVFTLQFTDWGERSTCVPEGCTRCGLCTHRARGLTFSRALPCGVPWPTSMAPFSTSQAAVPKGPVPCRGVLHSLSLLFWGGVGTLPYLFPSLCAPCG